MQYIAEEQQCSKLNRQDMKAVIRDSWREEVAVYEPVSSAHYFLDQCASIVSYDPLTFHWQLVEQRGQSGRQRYSLLGKSESSAPKLSEAQIFDELVLDLLSGAVAPEEAIA